MSEREQEARRRRLEALRGAGVDPFPARTGPRVPVAQVRDRFDAMDAEALEAAAESVAVCGRILAQRSFGKLVFLTLLDEGARIR